MTCPYADNVTCDGPNGNRWWVCPVHGARLTEGWTNLCRTRPGYYQAFEQGRGPGQKNKPLPGAIRDLTAGPWLLKLDTDQGPRTHRVTFRDDGGTSLDWLTWTDYITYRSLDFAAEWCERNPRTMLSRAGFHELDAIGSVRLLADRGTYRGTGVVMHPLPEVQQAARGQQRIGKALAGVFDWLPRGGCKNGSDIVAMLDRRGPAWVRENKATVIEMLTEQAKARGVDLSQVVADTVIEMCCEEHTQASLEILQQRQRILSMLETDSCAEHRWDAPGGPWPRPRVRNLLYHIWPFAGNNTWRRNVRELCKRIEQFNGRRVVAVAVDGNSDTLDDVAAEFGEQQVEYLPLINDPGWREVASLLDLWRQVETDDPEQITLYGHSKAVTRPVNDAVTCHPWADMMYSTCLDAPTVIDELLMRHPIVGTFKKIGRGFRGSRSDWHFSGTFYWLRNCELFRRQWRQVDRIWWGAESWPSLLFHVDEAKEILLADRVPTLNLYSAKFMERTAWPAYERWCADVLSRVPG